MTSLRLGIVSATGTGRKRTIPALAESALVRVTAVHGRDLEKLATLQKENGIDHAYLELDEMIAQRQFDIAMVCSPPYLHAEQATALIEAGIPTLIEKPVAGSVSDAEKIHDVAERTGVPVRIAHHLRHQSNYSSIRETLRAGGLGQIHTAFMEWSFTLNQQAPSSLWKLDPERNGLTCLSDAGVHCVDMAIGLLGPGIVRGVNTSEPAPRGTVETCDVLTDHGGVSVLIRASRQYGPYENRLVISGSAGVIDAPSFFTEESAPKVYMRLGDQLRTLTKDTENPYQIEVEDFAALVQGRAGVSEGTTTSEALAACQLIDAAERTLRR